MAPKQRSAKISVRIKLDSDNSAGLFAVSVEENKTAETATGYDRKYIENTTSEFIHHNKYYT